MHLEEEFLPRSLVYNYGEGFAESNKAMEKVIHELSRGNIRGTGLDFI